MRLLITKEKESPKYLNDGIISYIYKFVLTFNYNLKFLGLSQNIINNFFDEVFSNISNICNAKNYSDEIFGVAMTLFHYYSYFKSFRDFDRTEVSVACVFLACKIQYTFLKVEEAIDIFNRIKRGSSISGHAQGPDFTKFEVDILTFIGFEMDIETPHKYFVYYLEKLNPGYAKDNKIINFGFLLINDLYRSNLCIYHPSKYLAMACLFFTLSEDGFNNNNCVNDEKNINKFTNIGINDLLLCDKSINPNNFLVCLDNLLSLYETKINKASSK
jgi:hypothetical protein